MDCFHNIRMYKYRTIRELHLPKTSFATATSSRVYVIQSFFYVCSLKVIDIVLMFHCTNRHTRCLSDQQSTLSAFIVVELYCNCRRTHKPIKLLDKESAPQRTYFLSPNAIRKVEQKIKRFSEINFKAVSLIGKTFLL